MVCAETKDSDRRHLSELRVPGFGCPQLTEAEEFHSWCPGVGIPPSHALYMRERFRAFRQSKFECACHESCVVRICGKVKHFYVYAFYRNPGHDGSRYDCMLGSVGQVQSINSKALFVFVGDPNAHHLEWLESVSPTDGHGRDALDFCNLAGCEQMVRGATHIASNTLHLVITDAPDVVDVLLGTPLGTSDHCFVNCE